MSITIQAKQNCSFLFSSLGSTAANAASGNFLADYASIKNGSYAKLMKAYYAKDNPDRFLNPVIDKKTQPKAETKELAKVESSTDSLKASADALLSKGADSVFKQKDITTTDENGVETTVKGYDTDAIYEKVSGFIKDYNSVIKAADNTESTSVINRTGHLTAATAASAKTLSRIGITVNKDNTLSVNADTFKSADMNTVKSLFNGNGSYAYRVSAEASMINYAADREASRAGTYTFNGSYTPGFQTGNIFNGYI